MNNEQLSDFLTIKEKVINLDFIVFGENHIEKLKTENRDRTSKDYQTAINTLKRFLGSDSFQISQITVYFLNGFFSFITANPLNTKKNCTKSRALSYYLSSLRALHNAMKSEYNDESLSVINNPFSPFAKFKMPSVPVTKKRAIDAGFIKNIFDLPSEGLKNAKEQINMT